MRDIAVGDLVVVVRGTPCCGYSANTIGMIFSVFSIEPGNNFFCNGCGKMLGGTHRVVTGELGIHATASVRRIPPLSEKEEQENGQDNKIERGVPA